MKGVLDASALLAYLHGEPGGEYVEGHVAEFWMELQGATPGIPGLTFQVAYQVARPGGQIGLKLDRGDAAQGRVAVGGHVSAKTLQEVYFTGSSRSGRKSTLP